MSYTKQLMKIYRGSDRIPVNMQSKIVFMSDCHRGDGTESDDFHKNKNIYHAALTQYYREGFTYIELGDGDELWENKEYEDIVYAHKDTLALLLKFKEAQRLYMIYGNHDMVKSNTKWIADHFNYYYDERRKKEFPLFQGIPMHEGLVLCCEQEGEELFLLHGHQVDKLNDDYWKLSRFLVRYLWRPLQLIGMKDPFSAQKNSKLKKKVEQRLTEWTKREKKILIAGHTHRSVFAKPGESLYFNDGCCVNPRCVNALEIENGCLTLVKWSVHTRPDGTLYVKREIVVGPEKISTYFI